MTASSVLKFAACATPQSREEWLRAHAINNIEEKCCAWTYHLQTPQDVHIALGLIHDRVTGVSKTASLVNTTLLGAAVRGVMARVWEHPQWLDEDMLLLFILKEDLDRAQRHTIRELSRDAADLWGSPEATARLNQLLPGLPEEKGSVWLSYAVRGLCHASAINYLDDGGHVRHCHSTVLLLLERFGARQINRSIVPASWRKNLNDAERTIVDREAIDLRTRAPRNRQARPSRL